MKKVNESKLGLKKTKITKLSETQLNKLRGGEQTAGGCFKGAVYGEPSR